MCTYNLVARLHRVQLSTHYCTLCTELYCRHQKQGWEGGGWGWGWQCMRQGLQRDVVYLGWPIAPSYLSPNVGGGGVSRGLRQWVQLYTGVQINFRDLTPFLPKLDEHQNFHVRHILYSHSSQTVKISSPVSTCPLIEKYFDTAVSSISLKNTRFFSILR